MLVVKLVEKPDGTIIAQTRKQAIGEFKNSSRDHVVSYLRDKAREVGEDIMFVEEFQEHAQEHVNWEKLIKRHY